MGATPIQPLRGTLISALGVACAIALLTGCAGPESPSTEPTQTQAPTTSPSTEPTSEPEVTTDVLFKISANVRDVNGRTVGIEMSAHEAKSSTDASAASLVKEFLGACGAGNGAQPITEQYLRDNGSTLMRINLTTNTPGLTFVQPVGIFLGSPYFAQSATGAGIVPAGQGQTCFTGYNWTTSGTAHAIADFENSDGVPDLTQWFYGRYGFAVDPASSATIEACRATITELGAASGVTDIEGWDISRAGTGISCGVGYSGE